MKHESSKSKALKKSKNLTNPFDSFSGFAKGLRNRIKSRKGDIKLEDIPF